MSFWIMLYPVESEQTKNSSDFVLSTKDCWEPD